MISLEPYLNLTDLSTRSHSPNGLRLTSDFRQPFIYPPLELRGLMQQGPSSSILGATSAPTQAVKPVVPPSSGSPMQHAQLVAPSSKGKEREQTREDAQYSPAPTMDLRNGHENKEGTQSPATPSTPISPSLTIKIPALANRHHHHHHHHKKSSSVSSIYSRKVTPSTSYGLRPANSSAPMTRSHCRFHKVSIPLPSDSEDDETEPVPKQDREHTNFIIPACALSVPELMRVEGMVDCGPATEEENDRKTMDLSEINSDLLGLVRQLVGNDILRENDVGLLKDEHAKYAFIPSRRRKQKGKKDGDTRSLPTSSPSTSQRIDTMSLRSYKSNPSPLKRHFTANPGPSYRESPVSEEEDEPENEPGSSQPSRKKARSSDPQASSSPPLLSVRESPAVADQQLMTTVFAVTGSQADLELQQPQKKTKRKRKVTEDFQAYRPSPELNSREASLEPDLQSSQTRKRKRGRPKKNSTPSNGTGSVAAPSIHEGSVATSHSQTGSMSAGAGTTSPKPQKKKFKSEKEVKVYDENIVVSDLSSPARCI
jgi:hypothetical protein